MADKTCEENHPIHKQNSLIESTCFGKPVTQM